MRIKLLFIALSLSICACGQSTEDKNQNSEKTLIPGTRIYLEKPENFKPSKDFIGLESGQSVLQFIDLFGGNYNSNAKTFTKENFENKGVKVFDFKELKIDNYPAKLAFIQGNPNQKSLQLVFGDNEFSVMAMAFVPDFEKENIEKIKKALLTIEYDKERVVDPFEIAFFQLDDSNSSYKYSKTISNMFLYTKNGEKKDNFMGESAYLVSQLPTDSPNMNAKKVLDTNLSSLIQNGLQVTERKATDRTNINNFKCYEEIIVGTLNNQETHILMTAVVNKSKCVIIAGLAKDNFKTTIKEFEVLTDTLIMK
jgi:hypothetical protein